MAAAELSSELNAASAAVNGRLETGEAANRVARTALLSLCHQVAMTRVNTDDAARSLRQSRLVQSDQCKYILCDVLSILWAETESVDKSVYGENGQSLLAGFLNRLINDGIVESEIAQKALDPTLLERAGVIGSKEVIRKADIRRRTQRLYTQKKFNLLREETEGFAKLLTELNKFSQDDSCRSAAVLKSHISCLIGYFDLDPNRVLDIVLDSYEQHPKRDGFVDIIQSFHSQTVCSILGFKFRSYVSDDGTDTTPSSLFHTTASLIKQGLFSVDMIYAHLNPSDQELVNLRQEVDKKQRQLASNLSFVNLNAQQLDESSNENPYPKPNTIDLDVVTQKFELLKSLIECGAQESVDWMFSRLKMAVPSSYVPVSCALCSVLHDILTPAYDTLPFRVMAFPNGQPTLSDSSFRQTVHKAIPNLRHLGIYVFRDIILFSKVCRVLKCLLSLTKDGTNHPQVLDWTKQLLVESLLPAFSVIPSISGVSRDLWNLLAEFEYPQRYQFYGFWKDALYSKYSELAYVKEQTMKSTKYFRKRVSTGKVKEVGRQLARFSHNNPLVVMDMILEQIQAYSNMGPVFVDSFKYVSQMSLDVVVYILLDQMSDNRDKFKRDGTNIAAWFQSLCSFCGAFYRKYPDVELYGILEFVAYQLKDGHSLDLLILKELITNMTSLVVLESMSDSQLFSLAGSHTLRELSVVEAQQNKGRVRRNVSLLLDALKNRQLIMPLFVLISQQKRAICFDAEQSQISLMNEMYDKCQDVLNHFSELLVSFIDSPSKLASHLPSLTDCVKKFHLLPQDAFFIRRSLFQIDSMSTSHEMSVDAMETDESGSSDYPDASCDSAIATECRALLSAATWEAISPSLYADFWSLSLYDITVPREQYEHAIRRLEDRLSKPESGRTSKKESEMSRTIEKLKEDVQKQTKYNDSVLTRLRGKKDTWLASCKARETTCTAFLQHCVLPRCLYTAADSLYCAFFVRLLHQIGTVGFSTVFFVQELFKVTGSVLSSCTENEASRFGRFFSEVLQFLHAFADSEQLYNEKFLSLPGSALFTSDPEKGRIEYKQFLPIIAKWHNRLSGHLSHLLQSRDVSVVRNSLLFFSKIGDEFPRFESHGQLLDKLMSAFAEKSDGANSLKLLSQRTHAQLAIRRAQWLPDMPVEIKEAPKPRLKLKRPGPSPTASRGASPPVAPAPAAAAPTGDGEPVPDQESKTKAPTKEPLPPKSDRKAAAGLVHTEEPPRRTLRRTSSTAGAAAEAPQGSVPTASREKISHSAPSEKEGESKRRDRSRSRSRVSSQSKTDQSSEAAEERPAKRHRASKSDDDKYSKESARTPGGPGDQEARSGTALEKVEDKERMHPRGAREALAKESAGSGTSRPSREQELDRDRGSDDRSRDRDRTRMRERSERDHSKSKGQERVRDRGEFREQERGDFRDRERDREQIRERAREADSHRGRESDIHRGRDQDSRRSREPETHRGREPDIHRGRDSDAHQSRESEAPRGREPERERREPDAHRGREPDRDRGRELDTRRGHEADARRGREPDRERVREMERERGRESDMRRGRELDWERGREAEWDRGRDRDRDRLRGRGLSIGDKRESSMIADRDEQNRGAASDSRKPRIDRRSLFSGKNPHDVEEAAGDSGPSRGVGRMRGRGGRGSDDKRDKRRRR